ncbi:alpha-hydroxy-acid oxidizing protein, partial [bacterium]|nr:alpha-hydroxy-acid oxidizing protein [bacterium]
LGADIAGMARPMLKVLMENGTQALGNEIDYIQKELKLAMFLTGSKNIRKLEKAPLTTRFL